MRAARLSEARGSGKISASLPGWASVAALSWRSTQTLALRFVRSDGRQRGLEALVATFEADEFDLGTGEFAVGTEQVETAARTALARLGNAGALEQYVVYRQRK